MNQCCVQPVIGSPNSGLGELEGPSTQWECRFSMAQKDSKLAARQRDLKWVQQWKDFNWQDMAANEKVGAHSALEAGGFISEVGGRLL